jgi:hypothetical protein
LTSRITEYFLNRIGKPVTQSFSESGLRDPDFPYGACINWGYSMDKISQWDDVAIWSMEHFGLPGGLYVTDININDMTWWFRSEQDRLLFVLRNGQAQCIQLVLAT